MARERPAVCIAAGSQADSVWFVAVLSVPRAD